MRPRTPPTKLISSRRLPAGGDAQNASSQLAEAIAMLNTSTQELLNALRELYDLAEKEGASAGLCGDQELVALYTPPQVVIATASREPRPR